MSISRGMDKEGWYIYIMESYSAIKRKEIGSFVESWMDLETVLQSKVSQKNKYCILMYMYGIQKTVLLLSHQVMSNSFTTPWTIAHQAPLSMEFSRQEYWNRFPCPPPGESSQSRDQTHISCVSCWQVVSLPLHLLGNSMEPFIKSAVSVVT